MMCHFIISLTVHASSPNLIFQPVKPRVEKQPYKVQAVTIGDTEVASAQVPPGRPGPRPARLQLQGRRAHRPQGKRCEARSPLRNPFRRHVRQPGLLHARQWWMWWERGVGCICRAKAAEKYWSGACACCGCWASQAGLEHCMGNGWLGKSGARAVFTAHVLSLVLAAASLRVGAVVLKAVPMSMP